MPYINVKLAGKLDKNQKQEIAKEITDVMQRVANKPASYTYIVFEEVESEVVEGAEGAESEADGDAAAPAEGQS